MADLAGTHPARHAERDGRFDRFCAWHYPGETVLTRELATAWCQDTATGTWGAYRTRAIREFGKYLQLTGADAFIVPSAWIASPGRGLPGSRFTCSSAPLRVRRITAAGWTILFAAQIPGERTR